MTKSGAYNASANQLAAEIPKPYRPTWQERLEPFGDALVDCEERMKTVLRALDDDALAATLDATSQVTRTNCWCYAYQAAPMVKAMAEEVERERRLSWLREDADSAGGAE